MSETHRKGVRLLSFLFAHTRIDSSILLRFHHKTLLASQQEARRFALVTLARSIHLRPLSPFGCASDRKGLGPGMHLPFGSLTGIPRAREQAPQGGAMNTPRRLGLDSHRLQRAWPSLEVRSATKVFPPFFWMVLSTPKDEENPNFCKDMVTRAEPAQISTTNGCEGHV